MPWALTPPTLPTPPQKKTPFVVFTEFLVKSRAVTNKETAYGCDELVKKSKKTCVKASSKCAARAYEVCVALRSLAI